MNQQGTKPMPHAAPTPEDAFALLEALELRVARLPDDDLRRLDAALRLSPEAAAVWHAARAPATLNELVQRTNRLCAEAQQPALAYTAVQTQLGDLLDRGWLCRAAATAGGPTATLEAGPALAAGPTTVAQYVAAEPPDED